MQARTKAMPQATPETQPFWDAAREERLLIQRCTSCGRHYFYPRPQCPQPDCDSTEVEWTEANGRATLHTYMINHRAAPGFEAEAPYVIAVVQLEEGPRLMSNLVGVEASPDALRIDMPLQVTFERVSDAVTLPKFKPE